ncbi:hypothetical protein SynBIOSU31_02009 [Synechococcus sp. BIOS-U3-1]|nr:hypothetical protein SynBIOSU31_02009 [Synechococcus sp. BIOS-U3-1]
MTAQPCLLQACRCLRSMLGQRDELSVLRIGVQNALLLS